MSKLLRTFGTFFLALILAVIFWVVVKQQQDPFESRTVSGVAIEVRGLPADQVLLDAPDALPLADVRLRAPRSVWDILSINDLDAFVDLSDSEPGRHEFPVQLEIRVARADLLEVIPAAVAVRTEERVVHDFPVAVRIIDSAPFGYAEGTPETTPAVVKVSGPASEVERVARAEVSVRIGDSRTDLQTTEFVTLRDANNAVISGLTVEPRSVAVMIPIEQQQGFSEKTVLPRVQGQPDANYRMTGVSVTPQTITLFGDPAILAEMPPYVETAPVDIEGATSDIEEQALLVIPESVAIIGPQSVEVSIGVQPIEGSLTLTARPVIQGLGPGLRVKSLSPETIDVILLGPLSILQTLSDQNVRAVLDLSGKGEGVHEITPLLVAPEGVTVQTVLPPTVQVTIELSPDASITPSPTAQVTPSATLPPSILITPTP
ncbi:MAG: hypothetical protein J5I90_03240 [Caldilineales bacterium]|nr:hypothetical protein [Caldilineales bacterium]